MGLPPRRRTAGAVAFALVGSVLAGALGLPAEGAVPAYHPSRLTHLRDSRQIVVVTSAGWSSTSATLRAYTRGSDGVWRLSRSATAARIGGGGFVRAADRRQNTGTTPAGTFRLTNAFGSAPDPGTDLPYYRFDRSDWWVLDPRRPTTYNLFEPRRSPAASWRTDWAEHLWDFAGGQYRYAAVIAFNRPASRRWSPWLQEYVTDTPADTRRGGAIFLHVRGSGATAGCVAVSATAMRSLLRWLDPDLHPRIVMGPIGVISEM